MRILRGPAALTHKELAARYRATPLCFGPKGPLPDTELAFDGEGGILLRIGLAGRSQEKLERVRGELGAEAADWPLIVADSQDGSALAELAARTTAVATTVGPYRLYGMPLVEACAAAGTHYADLTGETLFMREAIERYDVPAK